MLVLDWFQKGGLFMWPLLLCSFFGLAAIIDRGIFFFKIRLNYQNFLARLKADLLSGPGFVTPGWLRSEQSPIAQLVLTYLDYINSTNVIRDEALKREGNRYLNTVDQRMRLLSAIATVSPLLGLLGTVAGLVVAFYSIESKGGVVQPSDLAGGIWEALISTVVGLCIGIPCLLMHQFYQAKGDQVAQQMQDVVSELDELVAHRSDKAESISKARVHGS